MNRPAEQRYPMALIPKIKELLQDMPFPAGAALARVPYSWRPGIGRSYRTQKAVAKRFGDMELVGQQQLILERMRNVMTRAASEIPFYRDLYTKTGYKIGDLKSFEDLQRIPIINKEQLQEVDLEARSAACRGRYLTNTGGSTGSPLNFYITSAHIPTEWAHMHTIWESLGYRQSSLLLTFKGRNLQDRCLVYDGLRNQYSVNVYMDKDRVSAALLELLKRRRVEFLHGYPSALYEFAHFCEEHCPVLRNRLRATLKGALFCSEFPVAHQRAVIERVFSIPTLSWYGHTERAILAWEKREPFVFEPFQTYGYCEAVEDKQTGRWRLVGTSYFNQASPFIRYDTGDDIEPVEIESGILRSFRIREGRAGDFVVDRNGVRIPLTALIFGRHHELFNLVKFLQVRQEKPGQMTVLVTPKGKLPEGFDFTKWFDASGLAMDVVFQALESPILTTAGKVALKVSSL